MHAAPEKSHKSFARFTFAAATIAVLAAGLPAVEARACEADAGAARVAAGAEPSAGGVRGGVSSPRPGASLRSQPSIAERAAQAAGGRAVHEIDGRRVIVRGGGEAALRAVEAATGAQAVAASGAAPVRLTGARSDAALEALDATQRAQLTDALRGARFQAAGARDAIPVREALISAEAVAAARVGSAISASGAAASAARATTSAFAAASTAASGAAASAASSSSASTSSTAPAAAPGTAVRAGFYDTSEYMAGRVAVNVVFVESTRSGRGWSDNDREDAMSDLVESLDMWAGSSAAAKLSFTYRTYRTTTALQPIEESSDRRDQWIQEACEQIGNAPYGTDQGWRRHYMNVYELNNRSRDTLKTDWAFTVFFVRAANSIGEVWDARNGLESSRFCFADGQHPFTMLGGPYMVMPFSKVWGVHFWNAPILTHETGHAFHALDEYAQYAQQGHRPDEKAGYFAVANGNLQTSGAQSDDRCIMRGSLAYTLDYVLDHIVRVFTFGATSGWDYSVCRFTRGQVGQIDANANGRLDIFDAAPSLAATTWIAGGRVSIEATAAVGATQNLNPYTQTVHPASARKDLSIDSIVKLRWRVDGGAWRDATPAVAGVPGERFSLSLALPAGATRASVELEAITKYGPKTVRSLTAEPLRMVVRRTATAIVR